MNNTNLDNEPSSGTLSRTRQPLRDQTHDSAFFTQQADDAQRAMTQTLHDMQVSAKQAADPRLWTQQYPWIAVGSAAVAGFFAVSTLFASGNGRGRRAPADRPPQPPPARPSMFSSLFGFFATTVQSAVTSAITVAINEKINPPEQRPADADGRGYDREHHVP